MGSPFGACADKISRCEIRPYHLVPAVRPAAAVRGVGAACSAHRAGRAAGARGGPRERARPPPAGGGGPRGGGRAAAGGHPGRRQPRPSSLARQRRRAVPGPARGRGPACADPAALRPPGLDLGPAALGRSRRPAPASQVPRLMFPGRPRGAPIRATLAVLAHGISDADRQRMLDGGYLQYVGLGASHMLTGYDHLLFLFGVVFFLASFKDVVKFVTVFTLGHSITLVFATMLQITWNYYLIDAIIAISVMYKAFDNNGGFQKHFQMASPNLLWMVFGFGLLHGFGLPTRLPHLPLGGQTEAVQ